MSAPLPATPDMQPGGQQEQPPLALVYGKVFHQLPQDLYIPPDALEVILEAFEGPLDLLLYLIRRQNVDILDIPVAIITRQYMQYVQMMREARLELAAEYLVMAAMLAEIKSRMLLPRQSQEDEEEEDPRAELVRRLQEYERFKQAAEQLEQLPRVGREVFLPRLPQLSTTRQAAAQPDVSMDELMQALADVIRRSEMFDSHQITQETLSTRERMSMILERLSDTDFIPFNQLFTVQEGRLGVVVTFMAILELVREALIELVQNEPYAPIHIRICNQ